MSISINHDPVTQGNVRAVSYRNYFSFYSTKLNTIGIQSESKKTLLILVGEIAYY